MTVLKKGVKHQLQVEHCPNMQAFIDGILEQRCHLCAVFVGGVADWYQLRTVENVVEKLDEYHDRADGPLFIDVLINFHHSSIDGDPEQYSVPSPLETDYICLGLSEDDSSSGLVSSVRVKYHKRGTSKRDVSPELLSAFTGSEQSLAFIKRWLQICHTEHWKCRSIPTRFAPTRLLDLGTQDTNDIRLVAGSTIGRGSYAALSYCWGSVPQLVLTSENQSELRRRIPFESLSTVARDAATVCRGMSIRYLWIDAMCIMQGPGGDFHQEAAHMDEVYANALFTICAGASANTTQPFLVRRDPLWWTQCHLIDESGESLGYISADYCEFGNDVPGKFNLDSRGWCFQEQFLSPRSIYFGPKDIHWICREGTVCDRYPDFEGCRGTKDHKGSRWQSPKQLYEGVVSLGNKSISEPGTWVDWYKIWRIIREDYSRKQLRYQSDKLLALAGVASIIQRKFNATSSFGLWLEFFLDELLWIRFYSWGKRLDIAPSWSWASMVDCGLLITFPYAPDMADVPDTECRPFNSVWATIISLPPVTGFAIPLQHSGYGSHTSIRLSGRLTACVQHHEDERRLDPKNDPSDTTQRYGFYYPDSSLEEENLHCFLIRRHIKMLIDPVTGEDLNRGETHDYCLVLTPVLGSDHLFRRTGTYFEWSNWNQDGGVALSLPPRMFRGEGKEQEIEII